MMRGDGGRGLTYFPAAGQYPDVSQITAVQVTPRPKPRAFPRTNPSYVSVHRRDGGNPSAGAFRHVDTMAASAFNHGYQLRGQPERSSNSGRYYPSHSGAQTLQTSHSYLGNSDSGRRSAGSSGNGGGVRAVAENEDDVDSDSSMSSSSSDASTNGLRRQYTLDSRPSRRLAQNFDQSPAFDGRSGVAGLAGISAESRSGVAGTSAGAASRHSEQNKSADSSPLIDHSGPVRRSQRGKPKSESEIPAPPRAGAVPNGVVRPSTVQNHPEPDYVNVPTKSESQDVQEGSAANPAEQSQKSVEPARERPGNPDELPRSGDGTLRIRDHVSPAADYVNCQDIVVASSNIISGQPDFDGTRHLLKSVN